jgi:homoserine O-acetyltransferase
MDAWTICAVGAALVLLIPGAFAYGRSQQFAHLGDFRLESGEIITDAVVGYRTAGKLNASKSNAVLVAPWFQGNTGQLARQIGPGKLVDTSKYFVIMVDALGNGVSSSPSTSTRQREERFPAFTMADIVESQYQLATRALQLTHLHAVVGISMGGMQVFQWTIAHPQFMDKAVSIVGSPQSQPDDRQRWTDGIEWLRDPAWTRARLALSRWKPRAALNELRLAPHDHIRQARAIMDFDITRPFGGSMDRAAAAIRADLMVVSTWQDREVNPKPAFDLARIAGAHVLELDGRCGHQAPSCERATLWPAVARFLDR